jgi:hypothetical protein
MDPTNHQDADPDRDETVLEAFLKLIAGDPRFVEAKPAGEAIVITGARPPRPQRSRRATDFSSE